MSVRERYDQRQMRPSARARAAVADRLRSAGSVFAEDEADVLIASARTSDELMDMVERRADGHPLEHVVGWAEFCGVRIAVDDGVFVPRRRTELLVRRAVRLAESMPRPVTIVDLGCGTGAIGAVLGRLIDEVEISAVDIDPAAVHCARRNLDGVNATVYEGDLLAPLPAAIKGTVGLLVANMPYVPTAAIELLPAEAREYEPRMALDGGSDGLDLLRRVAAAAPTWLAPGGYMLVEVGAEQAAAAEQMVSAVALAAEVVHDADLQATVVTGRRDG